jgi:hypothetical protein
MAMTKTCISKARFAKASPGLIAVIGLLSLVELAGLVAVIARAMTP